MKSARGSLRRQRVRVDRRGMQEGGETHFLRSRRTRRGAAVGREAASESQPRSCQRPAARRRRAHLERVVLAHGAHDLGPGVADRHGAEHERRDLCACEGREDAEPAEGRGGLLQAARDVGRGARSVSESSTGGRRSPLWRWLDARERARRSRPFRESWWWVRGLLRGLSREEEVSDEKGTSKEPVGGGILRDQAAERRTGDRDVLPPPPPLDSSTGLLHWSDDDA